MFGCGISTECSSHRISGKWCEPFSILADLCTDMPGMTGCKSYKVMCKDGTKVRNSLSVKGETNTHPSVAQVKQCKRYPPLPKVLTTSTAMDDVVKLCTAMPSMDGCLDCYQPTNGTKCNCGGFGSPAPSRASSLLSTDALFDIFR